MYSIEQYQKIVELEPKAAEYILTLSRRGWDNLPQEDRTHLCVYYIDKSTLEKISQSVASHGKNPENWKDLDTARIFKCSIYAQASEALNIPSIGDSNVLSRMFGDNSPAGKFIMSLFRKKHKMPWAPNKL